jgi:hypothetical protein
MPVSIRQIVEDFIAEHHVEQSFFKRERSTSRPATSRAGGPRTKHE